MTDRPDPTRNDRVLSRCPDRSGARLPAVPQGRSLAQRSFTDSAVAPIASPNAITATRRPTPAQGTISGRPGQWTRRSAISKASNGTGAAAPLYLAADEPARIDVVPHDGAIDPKARSSCTQ